MICCPAFINEEKRGKDQRHPQNATAIRRRHVGYDEMSPSYREMLDNGRTMLESPSM